MTNRGFLKSIFELIESNHENDEFISTSIKFLLSFNLRFDYPHNNPVLLTLVEINEQISSRELIERLILLFNRDSKINFLSNRVELRGTEQCKNSAIFKFPRPLTIILKRFDFVAKIVRYDTFVVFFLIS